MLVTKHQRYKPSAHASAKLWRKILILQARAKQEKTRRQAESSVPQAGCSEEFEPVVWTLYPYHLELEVHQSIVRHVLDRAVERRDSSTQSESLLSPRKLDLSSPVNEDQVPRFPHASRVVPRSLTSHQALLERQVHVSSPVNEQTWGKMCQSQYCQEG